MMKKWNADQCVVVLRDLNTARPTRYLPEELSRHNEDRRASGLLANNANYQRASGMGMGGRPPSHHGSHHHPRESRESRERGNSVGGGARDYRRESNGVKRGRDEYEQQQHQQQRPPSGYRYQQQQPPPAARHPQGPSQAHPPALPHFQQQQQQQQHRERPLSAPSSQHKQQRRQEQQPVAKHFKDISDTHIWKSADSADFKSVVRQIIDYRVKKLAKERAQSLYREKKKMEAIVEKLYNRVMQKESKRLEEGQNNVTLHSQLFSKVDNYTRSHLKAYTK